MSTIAAPSQIDLRARYREVLDASGLVDGITDVMALDPKPYRVPEGECLCRRGDPTHCLWVIVDGAVSVRDEHQTLFVRQRGDVVGEQNLLGNGCQRLYDLVASHSRTELLAIERSAMDCHPQRERIWQNISKIISLKLKKSTIDNARLLRQIETDTHVMRAYTNEYALGRRLQSGGLTVADHRVERAIIWFSDVVNFCQLIANMTPTRIADLVQRFFNAQTTPIQRRGGYIDKFVGDGLMAFWILPPDGPALDTCEETLKAAQEAIAAVEGICVGTQSLELRIGLHVGEVLSGDFGSTARHQFTLIGPEVNKTARLEDIHIEDVISGDSDIGSIRLSAEFRNQLSEQSKELFAHRSTAVARNVGEIEFFN